MGLNRESRVHFHATADRATGVVQGRRTKNRTTHLNLNLAVRSRARALASTMMKTMEIPVNSSVLRSDRQKMGSSRTCR
jgi:hypothetical protein